MSATGPDGSPYGAAPTEPTGSSRFGSRGARAGVALVVVAAVGVGAYFIASAVTASPKAAAPVSKPSGASGVPGAGARHRPNFAPDGTPLVTGTVAGVGSGSFTVTSATGTVTVDVSSTTRYIGLSGASFSSLKNGVTVSAFGTKVSSTEVKASAVVIGNPSSLGRGGSRRGTFGSITSIGSNSFTVSSRTGSAVTVDVTSTTTYSDASGALSGLSSLKKGEDVIVTGTADAAGTTVKATAVRVFTPGDFGGGGGGGGFGGGFGGGGFGGGSSST